MNRKDTLDINSFTESVIDNFHIDIHDLTSKVKEKQFYESLIFSWIKRSFYKGKSTKETIRLIHRARNVTLLHNTL
ncbi:hypothetical protein [Aquimarina sp. SS2-1]|uniref:hypothetical protein n=1 Tax=Aquimarina besae TaxID=3342247 RepID=UPI0036727430